VSGLPENDQLCGWFRLEHALSARAIEGYRALFATLCQQTSILYLGASGRALSASLCRVAVRRAKLGLIEHSEPLGDGNELSK
jgi:hypothetical protein